MRKSDSRPQVMHACLTPKQQRFVEEYLVDLNASAAARRAGYSERTAFRSGQENMQKHAVTSAIAAERARLSEKTGRTVTDVMADIGRVRDDAMREVVDQDTGERSMLSHKDALKALELEGKHLGAFERDNSQKGVGLAAALTLVVQGVKPGG